MRRLLSGRGIQAEGRARFFRSIRGNGFTLIEALAAFAILTLVMAGLLSGVSGAVHNDDRADFLLRASRFARSQLDVIGIAAPIAVGETTGRSEDGLSWTLTIEPYGASAPANAAAPKLIAYWVRLTVRRAAGAASASNELTFGALKLVAIQEKPQ